MFDKALAVLTQEQKTGSLRDAFRKAIQVIISSDFPDEIHEKAEEKLPWLKLLDSADYVEGLPSETITKTYLKVIVGE